MNREAIAAIADLLAAGGVIASVLYVAAQIRQNTEQSRSAAQQAFVQELGSALRTQAQNPRWPGPSPLRVRVRRAGATAHLRRAWRGMKPA
jgi:hypothetical protein